MPEESKIDNPRNKGKAAYNRLDLTGVRFGKLVATGEFISHRKTNKYGHVKTKLKWKCLCDCGNEHWVWTSALRPSEKFPSNRTTHCGCSSSCIKADGALRRLYRNYKKAAESREYTFSLDAQQFEKLVGGLCAYCGAGPKNLIKHVARPKSFNGIDRVDNTKGYEESNCVTCCKICNRAKSAMTAEEFKEWIKRAYLFLNGRAANAGR